MYKRQAGDRPPEHQHDVGDEHHDHDERADPVDEAGAPIRNAILWNDERSRQEVASLKRTFQYQWTYTGVELRLIGFGAVVPAGGKAGEGGSGPAVTASDEGQDQ